MKALFLVLLTALWVAPCAIAVPRVPDSTERFPGWKGDSYQPRVAKAPAKAKAPKMTVLHEEARIFLFENFLTDEEADHIIALAEPRIKRSSVVTGHDGESVISNYRTSQGTFLDRGEDDIITEIERRIARWTLLPMGNGEGLQVLRYGPGQRYGAHADYFDDDDTANVARGGNRYATVLMYLADTEEGGETVFPNIPAPGGDNGPEFSECARFHLAAKPKKGAAVLFHSMKPNGDFEPRSMHTACPVIKGVKWSAPKWIRVGHFKSTDDERRARVERGCMDMSELCPTWAEQGECEKNAEFMVGTPAHPGDCLRSCNRCDLLAASTKKASSN